MFVGSFIRSLDLVAAVRDRLDGPVNVLNVEDFDGGGGDDAKVVAGAVHGPEEIGFGGESFQSPVCQDDV